MRWSGVPPPSRQAVTGQSGTTTAPSGHCVGIALPVVGNVGAVVDSGDGELGRDRATAVGKVVSVEDGEEVEQVRSAPCVQSRSPISAPLGISVAGSSVVRTRRMDDPMPSCYDSGHLLDTGDAICWKLEHGAIEVNEAVNQQQGYVEFSTHKAEIPWRNIVAVNLR
ncbi:hypothetical protein PR202_gb10849 [Eleusine coracana subsp. coracana]|uniref:Uncharacterized protein n=1 Tax=Eleusine coracana subsp. coracana TaxID=191504 RepID=A0AAV5ELC7_ELECO|nr:hypothetical protein PR202_gb10849 [Eleusine coracana subsp. coracana]